MNFRINKMFFFSTFFKPETKKLNHHPKLLTFSFFYITKIRWMLCFKKKYSSKLKHQITIEDKHKMK